MSDGYSSVPGSFAAGSRIAGYLLEEQIGRGGMAVVFRARDERLGRLVALKILAPALAADDTFRQRFLQESRAAAAVDDPHIIPVHEAGEAAGVLYIAMRYVPGGDVRTLLQREGTVRPARAAAIISPVASALDAAHAAGLVHRDVKPANMLLDARPGRPDHVYLSDFGLSKRAEAAAGLTRAGQIFGTPYYMSPEQIESKPVDGRCDQYALACAAFELLGGSPPFQRDDPTAVMYAHIWDPPPLLTSRRPDLPAAVDQVFVKALAKAPQNRYPSCAEFAGAVRAALGLPPYAEVVSPDGEESSEADRPDGDETISAKVLDPAVRDGGRTIRRRARARTVALAGTGILAAAGIVVAIVAISSPGHRPGKTHTGPAATVAIAAKSGFRPVSGYELVLYQGGKYSHAHISAAITGASRGEVARLYAQQFPYRSAPTPVDADIALPADPTGTYSFLVTPSVATRYRIELFASRVAKSPAARSATVTIYVVARRVFSANSRTCGHPVCYYSTRMQVFVPASALATEIAKQWYAYSGVRLSTKGVPRPPKWVLLGANHARLTYPRAVSASEFDLTIMFSYQIGNDGSRTAVQVCTRDTEMEDGIGLPGSHGCGSNELHAVLYYVG